MYQDIAPGLKSDGYAFTSDVSTSFPYQAQLGEIAYVKGHGGYRVFRYMKAQEAISLGQVVSACHILDVDVDSSSSTSATVNYLQATGDFTANAFNDGTYPESFVSIDANTGIGQTRGIKNNMGTSDYIYLEDNNPWDVALDATSDYVVYNLNYVQQAATGDAIATPRGVAICDVASGGAAWFQIGGFCPLVRAVGSTDALVAGRIATLSSTAGACKGPTGAGVTALEVERKIGIAMHAYGSADSAGRGVAVILDIP